LLSPDEAFDYQLKKDFSFGSNSLAAEAIETIAILFRWEQYGPRRGLARGTGIELESFDIHMPQPAGNFIGIVEDGFLLRMKEGSSRGAVVS
jgi:hypothetical protein